MSLFPVSPTNGQTTTVNGITYTYNSSQTAWLRTNATVINTLVVTGNISVSGTLTSGNLADAVGYKGTPINSKTAQYTLALSDIGSTISITTGGIIIPANSSVAFPVGSTVVVYNNSAITQQISITTDTLRKAGGTDTGNTLLAAYGIVTLSKVASTVWVVSGNFLFIPSVNYLIVAGGGGGGDWGGGGAGGLITGIAYLDLGTYPVVVGAGGAGQDNAQGSDGTASSWNGISATGGGGGGGFGLSSIRDGRVGGSGGGAGYGSGVSGVAGAGTSGQGSAGGAPSAGTAGAGGGGAGAVGSVGSGTTGGAGGAGSASSISGASVTYAGGGGGAGGTVLGAGGAGGGGNGGRSSPALGATNGTNNTGGGGGGGYGIIGGNGGSGVVIIAYTTSSMTATGGTITTSGSNTIHTFTANGTFTRTL